MFIVYIDNNRFACYNLSNELEIIAKVVNTIKLPRIITGEYLPRSVELALAEQARKEAEKRADRRHNWLVASYGIMGGAIASLIIEFLF